MKNWNSDVSQEIIDRLARKALEMRKTFFRLRRVISDVTTAWKNFAVLTGE